MRLVLRPVTRTFDSLNAWRLVAASALGVLLVGGYASAEESPEIQVGKVVAFDQFDYPLGSLREGEGDGGSGWKQPWRASRQTTPKVVESSASNPDGLDDTLNGRGIVMRGTSARNNPLRRALATPISKQDVFVRFELQYHGIETNADEVDPEFFVMWLDRLDGGDRATHAANIPNIGLHVADRGPNKGRNVFMVRIGAANAAWTKIEVEAGRKYQVIARLSKSNDEERAEYGRLDLWIDPKREDLSLPDATVSGAQSISAVQWVGFSTGQKTESTDQIQIHNLVIGTTWLSVLDANNLPSESLARAGYKGIIWDKPVDFRRDVFPVLQSRCFDCHAGANPDSGFRLDVYRELLGYSTGEVLAEPGRSRHSRLIQALISEVEQDRMPPDGDDRLSDQQVAMLAAWIDQGMKWDEAILPTPPPPASEHWAFQPITRPEIPTVANSSWIRNPIDAFVAKRHVDAGLTPAKEASFSTLRRRLHLDLIGLPSAEAEDATSNSIATVSSTDAQYEQLVVNLLGSPHYGERWGRYWLDLARWAESQGYQHDFVRPYAWRYRDYVIDAFNKDKPYDQFLKEQLAGDELQPYSDENLIATGFLGSARISGNQEDGNIQRNDVLVDIVNATGSVMLGLTLECAQCHNHKFDPVSQRDYYRLQAFFVNGQLGNLSLREQDVENPTDISRWIPKPSYDYYAKEVKSLVSKKLFAPTEKPHTWGYLSAATGDKDIQRYSVVNRRPISWQPATLRETEAKMLIRGEASRHGPTVSAGWPEVLGTTPNSLGTKPRSALADWMADTQNPLVARVWVNRIWQYHFGEGIVATASDFGVEGAVPSHPQLLDWLACELMDNGWSTKHIHRLIVQSSTYRQERKYDVANATRDPSNRLLWNWPRRRLDAEAIRDSVLVATGELDRTLGGVSIPPEREEMNLRRTIYLFQQRSSMPSVMAMFDAPSGVASCPRRSVSTVALQPLFMLNSQFMTRRAKALADIVAQAAGIHVDRQVQIAFERTLGRSPDADELQMAKSLLNNSTSSDDLSPLTQLCHALLNLNEFVYIP